MSAAFTLAVSNPDVSTIPGNVVYFGFEGGNKLNLQISNNSGYDVTIDGTSTGKFLELFISDNIINTFSAATLAVKLPWSVDSFHDAGGSLTFNLLPPAGGILLSNNKSMIIELYNVQPTSKGVGQIQIQYQFDNKGNTLTIHNQFSSISAPDLNKAQLIGDNGALTFSYYVNTGDNANPIMVSDYPVTADTAVENSIQLNFLFQKTVGPGFIPETGSGNGHLVNGWDPESPPVFRVFFPYFSAKDTEPATFDLTDCLHPTDKGYNAFTSARNIAGSFDSLNPKIIINDYWQILLDKDLNSQPVWIIQPLPANTYLFTAISGSRDEPGPFLNIFFSHLFSALPIDPENPDTLLCLQWENFPGYNEGLAHFILRKSNLGISKFTCELVRLFPKQYLKMTWITNADHCTVTGDPRGDLEATVSFYRMDFDSVQPLRSSYTLTAIGKDGFTKVSRTVNVQWKQGVESAALPELGYITITPDGEKLLFANGRNIRFFRCETLEFLPIGPLGTDADYVLITPDGQTLYYTDGDGNVWGADMQTLQLTPGSGYHFAKGNIGSFVMMTLSGDNNRLILGSPVWPGNQPPVGANELIALHTEDFSPTAESPVALADMPAQIAVGPVTGNIYVAMKGSIAAFDGITLQPLPLPVVTLISAGLMTISYDEKFIYTMSMTNDSFTPDGFILSKIDTGIMKVVAQCHINYGYDRPGLEVLGISSAGLMISADNNLLFIMGVSVETLKEAENNNNLMPQSAFKVLDTATMQESKWPSWQEEKFLPVSMALSPDGSQLILLVALNADSKDQTMSTFLSFDPVFV